MPSAFGRSSQNRIGPTATFSKPFEEIVDHWAPGSWRTWEVNFAVKVPSVQSVINKVQRFHQTWLRLCRAKKSVVNLSSLPSFPSVQPFPRILCGPRLNFCSPFLPFLSFVVCNFQDSTGNSTGGSTGKNSQSLGKMRVLTGSRVKRGKGVPSTSPIIEEF